MFENLKIWMFSGNLKNSTKEECSAPNRTFNTIFSDLRIMFPYWNSIGPSFPDIIIGILDFFSFINYFFKSFIYTYLFFCTCFNEHHSVFPCQFLSFCSCLGITGVLPRVSHHWHLRAWRSHRAGTWDQERLQQSFYMQCN